MPRSGSYLGSSLGCRDPEHIARWMAAMAAGRAKLHCAAIAKTTGALCRRAPLKFAARCQIHCCGAERLEVDKRRLPWLQRKLRCSFSNVRVRAILEAQIARIGRRQLRHVWKLDPSVAGATIRLMAGDRARVESWLRDIAKIEPDNLLPRTLDQSLWAGALCLGKRYTQAEALNKVKWALEAEQRWRTRTFRTA